MEDLNYLRAIRRSWHLLLAGLVVGAGIGWLALHHATPRYRASAELAVGYAEGTFSNEVASRDLASTRAQAFMQIAGARPVVAAAARHAGVNGAAASAVGDGADKSPLFTITVTGDDRRAVAPIANAYVDVLIPELTTLVGPLDSNVRLNLVDRASTPGAAYTPVGSRIIGLGAMAGVLVGLLLALLIEVTRLAVRTPEEVAAISDLKILGTVPADGNREHLPTLTSPRSARAEAYRQVRTAWLALKPPARVVAVTSATQGEGKTTVSTNLATAVSRSGRSVVLVDADLRRPRVAEVFDLEPGLPGLAALLAGEVDLEEALVELGDGMPSVIPAGHLPPDPSDLLSEPAFDDLVEQLRARFDYVVVDTPPTLPVSDALVVAPRMDAMILVSGIGRATPQRIRRMVSALERVDAHVAGVVPNGAKGAAATDYTTGYYYGARSSAAQKAPKRRSGERRFGGRRSARV